jgi:hypothetical protein
MESALAALFIMSIVAYFVIFGDETGYDNENFHDDETH